MSNRGIAECLALSPKTVRAPGRRPRPRRHPRPRSGPRPPGRSVRRRRERCQGRTAPRSRPHQ
ncbi:hypothetical protein [Streptosporangium sp. NPDC002607]